MRLKLPEKIGYKSICLVCLLLISGCMVQNQIVFPTIQLQKTIEPTYTPSLEHTIEAQLIPSPSPTVLPTFTSEESIATIQNLLQDNGGCQLPCVWGVNPSQTSVKQVKNFLSRFGKPEEINGIFSNSNFYESFGDLTIILWNEQLRTFINFSYYQNINMVESSVLYIEFTQEEKGGASIKPVYGDPYFSELVNYYLLPQVLSHYEKPSQILLLPFPINLDRKDVKPLFSMVLLYEDLGFLVEYLFPRESNGENFVGCPSKTAYVTLVSWDPSSKPSVEKMVERTSGLGINMLNYSNYRSLEDVTTMEIDNFENLFKRNNDQACISTPQKSWNNRP